VTQWLSVLWSKLAITTILSNGFYLLQYKYSRKESLDKEKFECNQKEALSDKAFRAGKSSGAVPAPASKKTLQSGNFGFLVVR